MLQRIGWLLLVITISRFPFCCLVRTFVLDKCIVKDSATREKDNVRKEDAGTDFVINPSSYNPAAG